MDHRRQFSQGLIRDEDDGYSVTTGGGSEGWGEGASEVSVDVYGPTQLRRLQSRGRERRAIHIRQSSSKSRTLSVKSHSQISPPLTPRGSRDTLPAPSEPEVTFHNYLRAFYPFHPSSTVSSTTDERSITVPINQGDVILVHTIHPNGWADGTLLASGARGWLPTNYCEAYEPPSLCNLLNALTHLWDLVRSGEHHNLIVFTRQDYVRGMIAGVRSFLVSRRQMTPHGSVRLLLPRNLRVVYQENPH
jgi:hypothetical protein